MFHVELSTTGHVHSFQIGSRAVAFQTSSIKTFTWSLMLILVTVDEDWHRCYSIQQQHYMIICLASVGV
jgi:hypothetical protein